VSIASFLRIAIISILVMSEYHCAYQSVPECVRDEIKRIKRGKYTAEVKQFTYLGKDVYFVDYTHQCCDFMSSLYDSDCNVLCNIGGFPGYQCPDSIWNNLEDEKIIYSNR